MEEFFQQYGSELAVGGSSTIGAFVVGFLKAFNNRLKKMDERLAELEKNLEINTALDKARNK